MSTRAAASAPDVAPDGPPDRELRPAILLGQRCARCLGTYFPLRLCCSVCGGELSMAALSGRGTVFSFTVLRHGSVAIGSAGPVVLGWVRLSEGPLVTARLTSEDLSALRIGDPVAASITEGDSVPYRFQVGLHRRR